MRINVAVPEAHVSAGVLNAALEATTRLNESMLRSGEVEPFSMARPQARWRPEPHGDEHFDHARLVSGRAWGDCDDLAPWHAASLRVTGTDRGAKAIVKRSGPTRWHAVVRRSDGRIDDPSLAAGMPGRGGVRGATQPPMPASSVVGTYIARPQLALRPVLDRLSREPEAWQARADLPWHASRGQSPSDIAMVSLHMSPVSDQAVVGALEGAIALGRCNGADEEHLDRLRAVSDILQGADWEDVAGVYGPDFADQAGITVGRLFGKRFRRRLGRFAKGAGRAARGFTRDVVLPLAPMAANLIPGAGPAVSMALKAATPALQRALRGDRELSPFARTAAALIQNAPQMAQAFQGGGMPDLSAMFPQRAPRPVQMPMAMPMQMPVEMPYGVDPSQLFAAWGG